jgi:CheY-like chemotaxis protein
MIGGTTVPPWHGSCLTITQGYRPQEQAMVAPNRVPIRVLCVDDNRDAAESLALILRLVGLQAEAAYDGPSALAAANRFRPDACVSDINMPGMDGYELARKLRAWAGQEPLLLVAVTARTTAEDRQKSADAGFDLHLDKPADPAAVVRTVLSYGHRLVSKDARMREADGNRSGGHQRA